MRSSASLAGPRLVMNRLTALLPLWLRDHLRQHAQSQEPLPRPECGGLAQGSQNLQRRGGVWTRPPQPLITCCSFPRISATGSSTSCWLSRQTDRKPFSESHTLGATAQKQARCTAQLSQQSRFHESFRGSEGHWRSNGSHSTICGLLFGVAKGSLATARLGHTP